MNGLPTTLVGSPYTATNPQGLNRAGVATTQYPVGGDVGAPLVTQWNTPGLNSGTAPTIDPTQSGQPYSTPSTGTSQNSDNHPILSATGNWVSSTTGAPWHGAYNNPNGTTQYYSNGQPVQDIGQVGIQTPQIGIQQIQKNPAISSQVAGAVSQNATDSNLLGKSFSQYLQEAQNLGTQGAQTLATGEAAINPSGTVDAINSTVANTGNQLAQTQASLTQEQNANQANIAAANQNYETTQNTALQNLGGNLQTDQNNYAAAALANAQQGYANALKQTNLYQLTSGTPSSGSGQLSNRYISDYNSINTPLQQQLAAMNIGNTNQLYGLGSNLQNQYLGNLQSQYAGQGALNQSLASQQTSNAQYMASLGTNAAQYLQGLQQQVATLSPQLQTQYLQSLGVPIQVAQAIMSGNTANLAQLTGLDQNANAYNFLTPYQNRAPQYLSPGISLPPAGGSPPWVGTGNFGGLTATAGDQLNNFGGYQQAWMNTPQGQQWQQAQNTSTGGNFPAFVDNGQGTDFSLPQNQYGLV